MTTRTAWQSAFLQGTTHEQKTICWIHLQNEESWDITQEIVKDVTHKTFSTVTYFFSFIYYIQILNSTIKSYCSLFYIFTYVRNALLIKNPYSRIRVLTREQQSMLQKKPKKKNHSFHLRRLYKTLNIKCFDKVPTLRHRRLMCFHTL